MKKITILVDQLHSHGGIEKLVAIKANYWADIFGYEVTIISTDQNLLPSIYELSKNVKFTDLSINYDKSKSFYAISNLLKLLKNIFLIQKHLLFSKPNFVLVASHIPLTFILPILFTKAKRLKEFHFSQYYTNQNSLSSKVQKYFESKYDFLIVLSKEEQKYYKSTKTIVIANPIIKEKSITVNSEKENVAIFVGRIAPVKQIEKLLEVWQKFHQIKPNWQLEIYGAIDSQYAIGIEKIIAYNKLSNTILLKGQSNTVSLEISKSKLLLLTSSQECFPMVILEAQSLGTTVVSFDSPTGPRNIITNESNGILVEHNNIDKFVKALVRLDENNDLIDALANKGIETSKVYDLDLIMQRWNELIFK